LFFLFFFQDYLLLLFYSFLFLCFLNYLYRFFFNIELVKNLILWFFFFKTLWITTMFPYMAFFLFFYEFFSSFFFQNGLCNFAL
jgi:hypothetical protein